MHSEGIKRRSQLTLQKVKQKSIAKPCQFDLNHWIVKFGARLGRHDTSPSSFIKVLICLREINYLLLLFLNLNFEQLYFQFNFFSSFFMTYTVKNLLQLIISVAYFVWMGINSNGTIFMCEGSSCDLVNYRSCKLGKVNL